MNANRNLASVHSCSRSEALRLEYITVEGRKTKSLLVLDNVNLDVKDNEFFVIIGPSGCGKSTLLFCIDGLMDPSEGEISLDGNKLTTPGPDRAVVFQEASLVPWKSVIQNVKLALRGAQGSYCGSRWRKEQNVI